MSKVAEKTIASVYMHGLAKMTPKGRKIIAKWLRSRADWMEKHGDLATEGRLTARYYA